MANTGRLRRWWLGRLPVTESLTLGHRNLYILPTRAGWMLGLTLLLLLLGSINYMLNLGYLLTFLLAGVSVVAMHQTHSNLHGLQIQVRPGEAVFAGQARNVLVVLSNPKHSMRYGLQLSSLGSAQAPNTTWTDAAPLTSTRLSLQQPATTRGPQPLEPLVVESRFPLGTFRAWAWCRPAGQHLVYPAPETPCPPLPENVTELGSSPETSLQKADSADELRPYRAGDPLKRVYWKKVAKSDGHGTEGWISRDRPPGQAGELWLDFEQCGVAATEARLSRLCAWVLEAERMQLRYGLRLPHLQLAPGTGHGHQKNCLEALALC